MRRTLAQGLHNLSDLYHFTDDEVHALGLILSRHCFLIAHEDGDHPQFLGWREIPSPVVNEEALIPSGAQYAQGALVSLWIGLGKVARSSHIYDAVEVVLIGWTQSR